MKNIIDVAINIINFERMKSVSVCISYSLDCGLWLDLVLFARLLVVIVVMSYRCPLMINSRTSFIVTATQRGTVY